MITKEEMAARVAKAKETRERNKAEAKKREEEKLAKQAAKEENVLAERELPIEKTEKVEKKRATTPWKPAKMLDIPENMKDPAFVYRFVNTQRQGNEMKKLQEGWEFDGKLARKLSEYHGLGGKTLADGTPLDSTYKVRELIVMRIPREKAESRDKYYSDRGQVSSRNIKNQMAQSVRGQKDGATEKWGDDSFTLYGNVEESKGG
jgi:hypothetical protein